MGSVGMLSALIALYRKYHTKEQQSESSRVVNLTPAKRTTHTFLRLGGLAVWERCVDHDTTDVYFLIGVSPDDVSFSIEGTCGQLDAA